MSRCPVIAVFGATGAQGGGLARAILADPARSFAVRAVTRRSDGSAARTLAALGAQVVEADLDDAASLERALQGAYGVFVDLEHAKHVAKAVKRAAVRHVVWFKLEDMRNDVSQTDIDGATDALFRDLPTTVLRTSFLWDNLIPVGMALRRAADGGLDFVLPMGTRGLPGIAAADIGPCALGIFQRCGQFIGQAVGIAGEHLDGTRMATALSGAIGEPVRYVPTSFTDMFRGRHERNDTYCAERAVELARELHPGLQSFAQWLTGPGQRTPLPAVDA